MMRQLYPHLTVEVDTEPFYADQVEAYRTALFSERNRIRQEMRERQEKLGLWLVNTDISVVEIINRQSRAIDLPQTNWQPFLDWLGVKE
jgi:hypothetical protein